MLNFGLLDLQRWSSPLLDFSFFGTFFVWDSSLISQFQLNTWLVELGKAELKLVNSLLCKGYISTSKSLKSFNLSKNTSSLHIKAELDKTVDFFAVPIGEKCKNYFLSNPQQKHSFEVFTRLPTGIRRFICQWFTSNKLGLKCAKIQLTHFLMGFLTNRTLWGGRSAPPSYMDIGGYFQYSFLTGVLSWM